MSNTDRSTETGGQHPANDTEADRSGLLTGSNKDGATDAGSKEPTTTVETDGAKVTVRDNG
jgi:hypothetical protein